MSLTLRAVSLDDQPLSRPLAARFGHEGGTIGRADHNTLALPDPERHISRQQAQVSRTPAGFVITNIGSANPITVRGQTLLQGQSAPLLHHAQVRIGGYLLEAAEDESDAEATALIPVSALRTGDPTPTPAGARVADAAAPVPLDEHEQNAPMPLPIECALNQRLSADNPFAELFGPADAAPAFSPDAAAARSPRLPDDFDPFAPRPACTPPSAPPLAPAGAGVFDDLIPGATPRSIDEAFELRDGRERLRDFEAGLGQPLGDPPAGAAAHADPLALFSAAPGVAPPGPTLPDATSELRAAFRPPPLAAVPVAPTAPQAPAGVPAVARRPAPADEAELWKAFCEGAGVTLDLPQGPTPALLRTAGALLRNAVGGTLELMCVRATIKQELHADVTVIQSRNNNPLKFSPDAQSALEQLLQPPLRGFLDGPAAMADAMEDLVGHAIGTMAGTRAALEGVLGRFAPQALEGKLSGPSMLQSLLPMSRKARLWELYLQHFESIRDEAQEDFDTLFGKAFLAAYEQQMQRLRQTRNG
ncbi:type VI secretion system-associated FHA domain protein TagH [Azohydromonas aeria]|uniref:type VI secretion system-associated FHA domain protein TagH n=1 Tax=Azohydromonas aeria TaxID=2590212 RepID=UPI0012F9F7D3|nr:type VI secretion system-associated FHA domain protein TagH [Azohydromonas aeria]